MIHFSGILKSSKNQNLNEFTIKQKFNAANFMVMLSMLKNQTVSDLYTARNNIMTHM